MSSGICLKIDCECMCSVCEKQVPLNNSIPVKVTRERKKLHIEWISCNLCNKWVHSKCTGLTKKETFYLKNLSKQTKVEQFFKCLKCSLKAAKVAGTEFSLITDSILINMSTQTSDCEALNYTDIEVSQSKSGNTEEVLNSLSIIIIKQPAEDLVNRINNFPR